MYSALDLCKVKGDLKAPFSIATTPRCRGGRFSIPGIAPLYLIMLSVKQGNIKYNFWVFGMTQPGIEPTSPSPLNEHSNHYANIRLSINFMSDIYILHKYLNIPTKTQVVADFCFEATQTWKISIV